MGIRGELFSTRILLQNRTYFFNVKENRMGDLYLNIVESKNRETGGFDRQSVILFAEDLQEFLKGFDESLRVMEKAVREKRRGEGWRRAAGKENAEPEARDGKGPPPFSGRIPKPAGKHGPSGSRPAWAKSAAGKAAPGAKAAGGKKDTRDGDGDSRKRKVVVKKTPRKSN
jgi:hypothetical protein